MVLVLLPIEPFILINHLMLHSIIHFFHYISLYSRRNSSLKRYMQRPGVSWYYVIHIGPSAQELQLHIKSIAIEGFISVLVNASSNRQVV